MTAQDITSRSQYKVTVTYTHPGTQPPIYVAGSFTTPPWEPHELHHTATKNEGGGIQDREYEFHKEFEVKEGRWQYKLRAGLGDWWMLDERAATVKDDAGNRNNLLVVGPDTHEVIPASDTPRSGKISRGTATKDFEPGNTDPDTTQRQTSPSFNPLHATEDRSGQFNGEVDPNEPQPARLPPVEEDVDADTEVYHTSPIEEVPIPITVVEKVPDEEPPVYGDTDRESLHEDEQARQADAEPDEMVVLSAPDPGTDKSNNPSLPEIPVIVVEKTDSTASHGDDMGPAATPGQKLAHAQRSMDAEPDSIFVVSSSEDAYLLGPSRSIDTPTFRAADTASEVADTAAMLDASPQGPKSADLHLNSQGAYHGHMFKVENTAVKVASAAAVVDKPELADHRSAQQEHSSSALEIANTAAEVADSAVAIEPDPTMDDLAAFASAVGYSQSDTESPRLEYGPLLPHERMLDAAAENSEREPVASGSSLRKVQASEDLDDPLLEPFPTDYNGILEQLRSTESHLDEDFVSEHGVSVSLGTSRPRLTLRGRLSPTVVSDDGQSPVLLSITEASEEDEDGDPDPTPMILPEAASHKAIGPPPGNTEYFVGDEAAFTSSRSSGRSTVNTQDDSRATIANEKSEATDTNVGFGVEAIMQAHALSLRNGRRAGFKDDDISLDGATDVDNAEMGGSLYPKSLPEGTTISVQERSVSVTPESQYDLAEDGESEKHPSNTIETFENTNGTDQLGNDGIISTSGIRHRNLIVHDGVQECAAPTLQDKPSAHFHWQNAIIALWVVLVDWISGCLARLRG